MHRCTKLPDITIFSRQCLHKDEIPPSKNKLFTSYSEKNCLVQCGMERVRQFCGCQPWNIPPFEGETLKEVCGQAGAACYFGNIENPSMYQGCGCQPGCQSIFYSTGVNIQTLDTVVRSKRKVLLSKCSSCV